MLPFSFSTTITPVMVVEKLKGNTLRRDWVPLEDISPQLPLAVIASEDGRFCVHWGVDWGAVREAVKEGGGLSGLRGASTIPMQTAKNLYLVDRPKLSCARRSKCRSLMSCRHSGRSSG